MNQLYRTNNPHPKYYLSAGLPLALATVVGRFAKYFRRLQNVVCMRSSQTGRGKSLSYTAVSLSLPFPCLMTLSLFWIPETLQVCHGGDSGHFQRKKLAPRLRLVTCTRVNLVFNSLLVIFRSQDPPPGSLSGFFGPKDFALP